jgi:hypothetical protein
MVIVPILGDIRGRFGSYCVLDNESISRRYVLKGFKQEEKLADICNAADTLDRCEVPFFGRLASSILDDE